MASHGQARDVLDVLIVGAGPAGSVAATLLARAGARVCLVDRASFPRNKLCGDSLNPGALSVLRRLGFQLPEHEATRVSGMVVSGHRYPVIGVTGMPGMPAALATLRRGGNGGGATVIAGQYPDGLYGLMLSRQRLDAVLVEQAVAAGVRFESDAAVVAPLLVDTRDGRAVAGVELQTPGGRRRLQAAVTIAADGRTSKLATSLGLLRPSRSPRRWAIGAYAQSDSRQSPVSQSPVGQSDSRQSPVSQSPVTSRQSGVGEMHIRPDGYLGVAPLADGLINLCVVSSEVSRRLQDPAAFLLAAFQRDPLLAERMQDARLVTPVTVLGPLAVEPTGRDQLGLLTAGDAAGFIDPMTGDGMCIAIRGAELAAVAAIRALACGWSGVHAQLRRDREQAFAPKWRFNRALRSLVSSPRLVSAAAFGGRFAPGIVRALIAHAADVPLARRAGATVLTDSQTAAGVRG